MIVILYFTPILIVLPIEVFSVARKLIARKRWKKTTSKIKDNSVKKLKYFKIYVEWPFDYFVDNTKYSGKISILKHTKNFKIQDVVLNIYYDPDDPENYIIIQNTKSDLLIRLVADIIFLICFTALILFLI